MNAPLQSPELSFFTCLQAFGASIDGLPVPDGKIHRFDMVDETKGKRSGWYRFFVDGIGAVYGDNRDGERNTWQAEREQRTYTPEEKAAYAQRMAAAKAQREADELAAWSEAEAKCAVLWGYAKQAYDGRGWLSTPYTVAKEILPYNARIDKHDTLLVPVAEMRGGERVLVSIQFIAADGSKKFKTGGKKKGCDMRMGKFDPTQPIVVCEGYATGCSIHQATGLFVVVAFDAGNLYPVVERLRAAHPEAMIAVAGDDDAGKPEHGNKGASVVEAVCAAFDCVAVTFELDFNQVYQDKRDEEKSGVAA